MLLLTTTGRRTHRPHTTPLLHHRRSDGSLLLVAANGTADWDPDWLLNLLAQPRVLVELDGERHRGTATVLTGEERDAAWHDARSAFPGLADAQAACRRALPLVRLELDGPR